MNTRRNIRNLITLLVLTAFLLLPAACGSTASPTVVATAIPKVNSESQEQPTQVPESASVVQQTYKVGDVTVIGDHVLVVLGWGNVPSSDFTSPDEGKKFVAVELLIVNNSQSAMSLSTMLQMSMKDETGQKYNVDLMASVAVDGGRIDGELAPGERIRGKVGFQIAEDAQGLQFVFDASVFGTGKVVVDLGAEPMTVEPPANIAGEMSQQTYGVSDVIAMGTTNVTVNEVISPAGDQFAKPDEGKKFLVVDLTIENGGATSISLSTLLQMSLKDSSGQKYDVDLMASVASGGTSPDGEISPGEKLRGQVGFQVPQDAAGLVFVFDADVWGTGKVFVAVP